MGGLTDPRVTYWEPAKWVARLRATMTGGGPVLLHTNMDAGHGGSAGRFDSLKETALAYAFAIRAVRRRLAAGRCRRLSPEAGSVSCRAGSSRWRDRS
jgi:protease II